MKNGINIVINETTPEGIRGKIIARNKVKTTSGPVILEHEWRFTWNIANTLDVYDQWSYVDIPCKRNEIARIAEDVILFPGFFSKYLRTNEP